MTCEGPGALVSRLAAIGFLLGFPAFQVYTQRPHQPPPALVPLSAIAPEIREEIRYATPNNFTGMTLYPCGKCYLREPVAHALKAVARDLKLHGLGLVVFDCYRPKPFQELLWKAKPDKRFVTPPKIGSKHSQGIAVDISLAGPDGAELDLGTPYDFFGPQAAPSYQDLPDPVIRRRKLLAKLMARHGFESISTEWWHFVWQGGRYPLEAWIWPCQNHP